MFPQKTIQVIIDNGAGPAAPPMTTRGNSLRPNVVSLPAFTGVAFTIMIPGKMSLSHSLIKAKCDGLWSIAQNRCL
jgi:hypothetical protein